MITELTAKLAKALVRDCPLYQWHAQVAIANGLTMTTLSHWLTRGLTSDEEPFAGFTADYYGADSKLARETWERLLKPLQYDDKVTIQNLSDWSAKRWSVSDSEASILGLVETKATKRRALVESLRNPSPELAAAIAEAGLVRADKAAPAP